RYKQENEKNTKVDQESFFFTSRRRHTRSDRDWSSDVCSSDLARAIAVQVFDDTAATLRAWLVGQLIAMAVLASLTAIGLLMLGRSEERRVGKECRSWRSPR